jgi:hypothetical protein
MSTLEVPHDRTDCEEALKEIERVVQDSLARARTAGNPEVEIFRAPLNVCSCILSSTEVFVVVFINSRVLYLLCCFVY